MSEALRKQLIAKAMTDCQHFKGIQHEQCRAGVKMREMVGGPDSGWAVRLPCLVSILKEGREVVECASFSVLSKEEAEQDADRELALFHNVEMAVSKVQEDAERRGLKAGSGGASEISCPVCKSGILRYSVASCNGHIHARCSTQNCMAWME